MKLKAFPSGTHADEHDHTFCRESLLHDIDDFTDNYEKVIILLEGNKSWPQEYLDFILNVTGIRILIANKHPGYSHYITYRKEGLWKISLAILFFRSPVFFGLQREDSLDILNQKLKEFIANNTEDDWKDEHYIALYLSEPQKYNAIFADMGFEDGIVSYMRSHLNDWDDENWDEDEDDEDD